MLYDYDKLHKLDEGRIMYASYVLDDNIPVVFVSRAFNGVTQDVYDYVGGGKRFCQDGVIFTTGLSGQKARIKLLVLLEANIDKCKLEELF